MKQWNIITTIDLTIKSRRRFCRFGIRHHLNGLRPLRKPDINDPLEHEQVPLQIGIFFSYSHLWNFRTRNSSLLKCWHRRNKDSSKNWLYWVTSLYKTPLVSKWHRIQHPVTVMHEVHVTIDGISSRRNHPYMLHITVPNENRVHRNSDELRFHDMFHHALRFWCQDDVLMG